jgi:hypothetical protein
VTLRIAFGQDSGIQNMRLEGWLEGEAVAELKGRFRHSATVSRTAIGVAADIRPSSLGYRAR